MASFSATGNDERLKKFLDSFMGLESSFTLERKGVVSMPNPLERAVKVIIQVADPDKIILFGSRTKYENAPVGDYDLLVLKKGVKENRKLTQRI